MDELVRLRGEIDAIDKKIVECFEKRTACVLGVAEYKIANGMPVLDSSREAALLESRAAMLADKTLAPDVEQLFTLLMKLSRARQQILLDGARLAQNEGIAAFQGEAGANSHLALMRYFGRDKKTCSYKSFEEVFCAVARGEAEFGVLPIENSSTGGITEIYDLFRKYPVSIVGESLLKIEHVLLGLPGARLEFVTDVYSHEQALMQCADYLKKLGVNTHPYYNTAVSARFVAGELDAGKAAIASEYAGELYGLCVLAKNISNSGENTTRFIVISAGSGEASANKASVSFVLEHKSGALAHALDLFADCGLNMVKIESRPLPGHNFEYIFYVDFAGEDVARKIENTLARVDGVFTDFKLLGCYRSDGGA